LKEYAKGNLVYEEDWNKLSTAEFDEIEEELGWHICFIATRQS